MLAERLSQYLDTLSFRGIPASEVIVKKDGKTLCHAVSGFSDAKKTKKATKDDLYFLYSSSKVMTATLGLLLVEEGKLSLSAPVSDYLPAYADIRVKDTDGKLRAPKSPLLVLHLFTMCGGCDYAMEAPEILAATRKNPLASTREVIDAYAAHPFDNDPGTHFRYSICHDILAAVIEAASGMTFSDFAKKKIWEPLGINDVYFHKEEPAVLSRLSAEYKMNADLSLTEVGAQNSFLVTPAFESGGAGVITTATAYSAFLEMLSLGGVTPSGVRLLKPETVALFRENRLDSTCLEDYNKSVGNRDGYGYGLGVRVHVGEGDINKCGSAIGEFGWGGAAGSYSLVDTDNRLSIFYLQHVLNMQGFTYLDHPHNVIREMVYEELKKGNL